MGIFFYENITYLNKYLNKCLERNPKSYLVLNK